MTPRTTLPFTVSSVWSRLVSGKMEELTRLIAEGVVALDDGATITRVKGKQVVNITSSAGVDELKEIISTAMQTVTGVGNLWINTYGASRGDSVN